MAGMRDRLVHNYLGVEYEIVSDVAANKAPGLRRRSTASQTTLLTACGCSPPLLKLLIHVRTEEV